MSVIAQAMGAVLLADFVSGAVHWFEDAYVRKYTPIIGRWIGEENIKHHARPRDFTRKSWWQSSWDLVLLSTALITLAWYLDKLTWPVWVFALVAANANQIHKWSHQNPSENGRFITWLQGLKLLQTRRHHAKHHQGERNTNYCSVTNVLNPVLDELEFWPTVERLIARTLGWRRKPEGVQDR